MAPPSGNEPPSRDSPGKDPGAFRTIREVSEQLGVPQHVLRFWETRFPELKPLQRGGNRRYYRPGDVAFAAALHKLLHQDGYTVKGVRKLISDHGAGNLVAIAGGGAAPARPARAPEATPAEPAAIRAVVPPSAPNPPAPAHATAPALAQTAPAAGAPPVPDTALLDELRTLRDRLAAALAA
jgi:DNA-binding transcriptional MerR regulator